MDENHNQFDFSEKQNAAKRLAEDLAEIGNDAWSTWMADDEMLSLMVDEALAGVDISSRYPTFYRNLLHNADLRQAFVDALGSVEKGQHGEPVALSAETEPVLDFLTSQSRETPLVISGPSQWRIIWRQTVEQLSSIFSPPELAYRSDPSLFDDPWFTLLRGETEVDGSLYTVLLECTLAEDTEEALELSLNIAVTPERATNTPQLQLSANLEWGAFTDTLAIAEEGRIRFSNIPLAAVLDEERKYVKEELTLTIVSTF